MARGLGSSLTDNTQTQCQSLSMNIKKVSGRIWWSTSFLTFFTSNTLFNENHKHRIITLYSDLGVSFCSSYSINSGSGLFVSTMEVKL